MTLMINDQEVSRVLTIREALSAIHDCFRSVSEARASHHPRLQIDTPHGWLRLQPGVLPDQRYMGFKAYCRTSQGVRYAVLLYDVVSGELLCIMDALALTRIRTGAHSGVATQYLSNFDSDTLGLLGSGGQAKSMLQAVAQVRKIKTVRVYSPTLSHRAQFAHDMERELGVEVRPVDRPRLAVGGCDIVGTATSNRTNEPILSGDWFYDGTHINAIGAVGKGRLEVDLRTFRRSSLVVVDSMEECLNGSQELINALQNGVVTTEDLVELSDIVGGKRPGRTSAEQITLFKSQGSGLQDVAAAARAYQLALKEGLGREIGEVSTLRRTEG